MSDLRERCLRNGDMCKMEDPPALGYAETFYKAAAELDRLTEINKKLCHDFNMLNLHGAQQDAEILRLTAALAEAEKRGWEKAIKTLASGLSKFAPDLTSELVAKFNAADGALDEFLAILAMEPKP